jgi:hypothetical protein
MAAVTQHGKDILHPQRAPIVAVSLRANAFDGDAQISRDAR